MALLYLLIYRAQSGKGTERTIAALFEIIMNQQGARAWWPEKFFRPQRILSRSQRNNQMSRL
jgi:hypothetical protein